MMRSVYLEVIPGSWKIRLQAPLNTTYPSNVFLFLTLYDVGIVISQKPHPPALEYFCLLGTANQTKGGLKGEELKQPLSVRVS